MGVNRRSGSDAHFRYCSIPDLWGLGCFLTFWSPWSSVQSSVLWLPIKNKARYRVLCQRRLFDGGADLGDAQLLWCAAFLVQPSRSRHWWTPCLKLFQVYYHRSQHFKWCGEYLHLHLLIDSSLYWVGGMGVLVFVPGDPAAGRRRGLRAYTWCDAESPGPVGKLLWRSRIRRKSCIWSIWLWRYCRWFCFWSAECHCLISLATSTITAGTGGFGIWNDSIAHYNSYYLQGCDHCVHDPVWCKF